MTEWNVSAPSHGVFLNHGGYCVARLNDKDPALLYEQISALPEITEKLKALAEKHAETIKDLGGCDHSVGICCCEDIRLVDETNALLKRISA